MWLLAEGHASTLFLFGLAIVVGVVMMRASRKAKRKSPAATIADASRVSPSAEPARATEFSNWEVRMHDLSRELSARLDNKIVAVEQLVREARQESEQLRVLISRAQQLIEQDRANPPALTDHNRPPPARLQAKDAVDLRPGGRSSSASPASTGRRYEDIYALADSGLDISAIAERVGSHVGEVELILSLRDHADA